MDRRITSFNLFDLGYEGDFTEVETSGFTYLVMGWGSECESALDDLLHTLQVRGYDVGGLEGDIKERWNPTPEIDTDTDYILAIVFNAS